MWFASLSHGLWEVAKTKTTWIRLECSMRQPPAILLWSSRSILNQSRTRPQETPIHQNHSSIKFQSTILTQNFAQNKSTMIRSRAINGSVVKMTPEISFENQNKIKLKEILIKLRLKSKSCGCDERVVLGWRWRCERNEAIPCRNEPSDFHQTNPKCRQNGKINQNTF